MSGLAGSTPVVLVADRSYAVGLAALLQSIVQHTRPCPAIFVIDMGLEVEHRRRAAQIADVHWIDLPAGKMKELQAAGPTWAGYAAAGASAKLALPLLLPQELERALYMDCDMLALAGLEGLLETDLQGKLLAAVRDVGHPSGHSELCAVGWPAGQQQPYFNAGLMLLDLQKLQGAGGSLAAILRRQASAGDFRFQDQDALNLLCLEGSDTCGEADGLATPWLQLPLEWNAQGVGTYARFRCKAEEGRPALFASAAELARYERHPRIVHFTGPPSVPPSAYLNPWVPYTSKPWAYLCQHPFVPAFFAALDATPGWRGWRPNQRQVAEAAAAELAEMLARVAAEHPGFDVAASKRQLSLLLQG